MTTGMMQTMEKEFERRYLIHIKPFLENKRAGSQEKEICETIIWYLFKCNTDPDIAVKTQGWIMAIDVLKACERQTWDSPKGPKPIHRRAIDRCLIDLEMARIIDKRKYLYSAKRRRPGPKKERENVFYRLCLAYVKPQDWEKLYSKQVETFVKVADQRNISVKLLESLKMRIPPGVFDEAVKAIEPIYHIKKHINTKESTPKEIIKSLAIEWGDVLQNTPRDPRIQTTDEVLKSILEERSKINSKESAERAIERKVNNKEREVEEAKARKDFFVNRKRKSFKTNP